MRRILECMAMMAMFWGPLSAQDRAVDSRIYLESRDGSQRMVSQPRELRRGDRVVAVLDWSALPRRNEVLTSEVPSHLSFLNASLDDVELSRDGGLSWQAADSNASGRVTHLRWRTGATRRLAYSAIVR